MRFSLGLTVRPREPRDFLLVSWWNWCSKPPTSSDFLLVSQWDQKNQEIFSWSLGKTNVYMWLVHQFDKETKKKSRGYPDLTMRPRENLMGGGGGVEAPVSPRDQEKISWFSLSHRETKRKSHGGWGVSPWDQESPRLILATAVYVSKMKLSWKLHEDPTSFGWVIRVKKN